MNSRARYEELRLKPDFKEETPQQRSTANIVEILQASQHNDTTDHLLMKVINISRESPNLSPVVVFQIAADVMKVDELCNE
jgi:hypothetical protein